MNPLSLLNGRATAQGVVRKRVTHASSLSASNAYNINAGSGAVNNNNNKNNSNGVRAVVALGNEEKSGWIDAYFDCIRHKLTAKQCNEYRIEFERDLWRLVLEVHERTYKPSESFCFVVTRPKLREIFAASFRDRIVQHWITLRLEPLLEWRFRSQGDVSFNCRKGYGTLRAVQTAKSHIERVSERYTSEAWVGKIDISSFFMSIDKEVLLRLLLPWLRENYKGDDLETLLWLTEVTVRHQPQLLCERRSSERLWEALPASKSLFNMPPNVGMPIGNITSQLLANFYLSYFDGFMLEECAWKDAGYVRFVDDAVVICHDKQFILDLRKKATMWLKKHLRLTLHKDKFYLQEVRKGVKFVGSVIKPGRLYTSNRTIGNMTNEVARAERLCKHILEEGPTTESLAALKHHVCSLNSYMGFCVHAYSYRQRRKMFRNVPNFWQCCYVKRRFTLVKIRKRYSYERYLIKKDLEEYEKSRRDLPPVGGNPARDGAKHKNRKRGRKRDRRWLGVDQRDPASGSVELQRDSRCTGDRVLPAGPDAGGDQQLP